MKCAVEGCIKAVKQQSLCSMHSQRLWRTGRLDKKRGKYDSINKTPDTGRGRRGFLEANTIHDIKQKAKQRGKTWTLSIEEAFKLIISKCNYCNFNPVWPTSRVGIDRVDNSIGYTPDNCISCCFTCNSAKGDKTLDEFILWIKEVHCNLA